MKKTEIHFSGRLFSAVDSIWGSIITNWKYYFYKGIALCRHLNGKRIFLRRSMTASLSRTGTGNVCRERLWIFYESGNEHVRKRKRRLIHGCEHDFSRWKEMRRLQVVGRQPWSGSTYLQGCGKDPLWGNSRPLRGQKDEDAPGRFLSAVQQVGKIVGAILPPGRSKKSPGISFRVVKRVFCRESEGRGFVMPWADAEIQGFRYLYFLRKSRLHGVHEFLYMEEYSDTHIQKTEIHIFNDGSWYYIK